MKCYPLFSKRNSKRSTKQQPADGHAQRPPATRVSGPLGIPVSTGLGALPPARLASAAGRSRCKKPLHSRFRRLLCSARGRGLVSVLRPRGNRIAGSHVRLGEQLEKPGSVSGQSSAPLGLRECDGGRVQEGGGVADRARDPQAAAQPQTRQLQRIREAFSQFFHHAFCVTRDGARRFYSPSGVLSRSVCGCDPGAAVRVHELLDLRLHLLQRHPEGAAFPAPVFGFPPCVVTRQHLLSVPDVVCGIGKPHIPNASK
jgi:hypothetical protein